MTKPSESPADRRCFAETVAAELAELRRDSDAWAGYNMEAEATMVSVGVIYGPFKC